jgi:hypothetical protein
MLVIVLAIIVSVAESFSFLPPPSQFIEAKRALAVSSHAAGGLSEVGEAFSGDSSTNIVIRGLPPDFGERQLSELLRPFKEKVGENMPAMEKKYCWKCCEKMRFCAAAPF